MSGRPGRAGVSRKEGGFTLIELVVAVAIVGILAAFAYPSYLEQTRSARRADAAGALAGLANAMERHYTRNTTYRGAAGTDAVPADTGAPRVFSTKSPVDGADVFYNLTINAATATTYTVWAARAAGPQAADRCGTLTLDQTGAKDMIGQDAGLTVDDCWR